MIDRRCCNCRYCSKDKRNIIKHKGIPTKSFCKKAYYYVELNAVCPDHESEKHYGNVKKRV